MATADELVTILGVEVSRETAQNLSNFKAGIDGVVNKLTSFALVAGGFMAAAGFIIKGAMEDASALETLSEKSGLSTDALQEWQYAAEKAGVSAQSVQGDLVNLNKTMASPIPGEFNTNFAMLGVSVRDANGALKSSDDLLGDVADRMSGMSRQQAMQWGSKIGISDDTVVMLRQGKEGLEELRKEAHEVGAIIPSVAIKRSEEFRMSLVTMQAALRGVTSTIAIATMPALQRVVEVFTGWIQENRNWIALNTDAFMQGFVNTLERVYKALQRVGDFLKPAIDKFKDLFLNVDRTEQFTHLLTGALLTLLIAFTPLIAKVALLTAVFTAISYAVEDLFTYMEGGDSVIGRLADAFNTTFPQAAELIRTVAGVLKDLFLGALEIGWTNLKKLGAAALEVFGAFGKAVNEVAGPVNEFISTFSERFPAIVEAVKLLAGIITSVLGSALDGVVFTLKTLFDVAAKVFTFLLDKLAEGMGAVNDLLEWFGIAGDTNSGSGKKSEEATPGIVTPAASKKSEEVAPGEDAPARKQDEYLTPGGENFFVSSKKREEVTPREDKPAASKQEDYATPGGENFFVSSKKNEDVTPGIEKPTVRKKEEYFTPGGENFFGRSKKEDTSKSDNEKYAPMPERAQMPAVFGNNVVARSNDQKVLPGAAGGNVQNSDNRTINQQIYTNDPQQAANLSLQGLGASPQINTAGLYAPVVR